MMTKRKLEEYVCDSTVLANGNLQLALTNMTFIYRSAKASLSMKTRMRKRTATKEYESAARRRREDEPSEMTRNSSTKMISTLSGRRLDGSAARLPPSRRSSSA